MSKVVLSPMRCYGDQRAYYIFKEYLKMFRKNDIDIITIGLASDTTIDFLCDYCDGLFLSGGKDVDPKYYGAACNPKTKTEASELEELEMKLIKKFTKKNKPIIGICRGIQVINVAFGGTLIQDINETKLYQNHLQDSQQGYHHLVTSIKNTMINQYLGDSFMTNSFHHQAIDQVAPGFTVSSYSEDKIIESIEKDNIIGVQWHPEKVDDTTQIKIMKLFEQLLK